MVAPIVEQDGEHKYKAMRIEGDNRHMYNEVIDLNAETTVVRMDRDSHVTEITVDMAKKKLVVSYR